jgi:hypothetical protein
MNLFAEGVTWEAEGGGVLLASSPSALRFELLENGRRHRNGRLHVGAISGNTVRVDRAKRRLDAVLLMT